MAAAAKMSMLMLIMLMLMAAVACSGRHDGRSFCGWCALPRAPVMPAPRGHAVAACPLRLRLRAGRTVLRMGLEEELSSVRSMKVAEIKRELSERGLATDDMFEKEEFVRRLAQARADKNPRQAGSDVPRDAEPQPDAAARPGQDSEAAIRAGVEALRVSEIKSELASKGVSTQGLLEKSEFVELLVRTRLAAPPGGGRGGGRNPEFKDVQTKKMPKTEGAQPAGGPRAGEGAGGPVGGMGGGMGGIPNPFAGMGGVSLPHLSLSLSSPPFHPPPSLVLPLSPSRALSLSLCLPCSCSLSTPTRLPVSCKPSVFCVDARQGRWLRRKCLCGNPTNA